MYGRTVGGAEMQFIELANYLAQYHKVSLISLGGDGCINAAKIDSRIIVKTYKYKHGYKGMIYPMLVRSYIENIFKHFDITISTSFYGDLINFLLSISGSQRKVSLQTVSKCMQNPKLNRFILTHFDYLIAGAEDIKYYLLNSGQSPTKVHVIYNWVDFSARNVTKNSSEVKAKYGFKNKFVIGCIGRLHVQKGQIYLIRAFAKISTLLNEHVLVLVGQGLEHQRLVLEAERLGLSDKIFFLGELSGESYNNLLSAIDLYIQPSVFEGLPRTVLDAMYMGKPVIATDANGIREVITHANNGYLVEPKNVKELANAIHYLSNNKEVRMAIGKQAAAHIRSNFDMKEQLAKIQSLVIVD